MSEGQPRTEMVEGCECVWETVMSAGTGRLQTRMGPVHTRMEGQAAHERGWDTAASVDGDMAARETVTSAGTARVRVVPGMRACGWLRVSTSVGGGEHECQLAFGHGRGVESVPGRLNVCLSLGVCDG